MGKTVKGKIKVILGSTHAIPYRYMLFVAPFLILGIPLAEMIARDSRHFLAWLLASLTGSLFVLLTCFIVDKTFFKNRMIKPVPNSYLFLLGLILGSGRGLITGLSALKILKIPEATLEEALQRTITAGALGFFLYPVICFASYAVDRFQKDKIFADERLSALKIFVDNNEDQVIINDTIRLTKFRLEKMRLHFKSMADGKVAHDAPFLANVLESLARDAIRPLSHQIIKKNRYKKKFQIFEIALRFLPDIFHESVYWIVALTTMFQVPFLIDNNSLRRVLILVFVNLILSITFFYLIRFLVLRNTFSFSVNIFVILSLLLVQVLIYSLAHYLITGFFTLLGVIVFYILTVFFVFTVLILNSVVLNHEELIESTDRKYITTFDEILRRSNTEQNINRELARFLHGTLQTRISASAFRFRNSHATDFDFDAECQKVLEHFELEMEFNNFFNSKSLTHSMNKLKDSWAPILNCQITIEADEERISWTSVSKICDLINEALSNALRHGNADSAEIKIFDSLSDIFVIVINNGHPTASSSGGLGSKVFDELTNKRWELKNRIGYTGVRFSGLISRS